MLVPFVANGQGLSGDESLTPQQIQSQQLDGFVALSDANFSKLFGTPPTPSDANALANFFNSAFKTAISVGAILAVLRLAWAGYLYMGNDMWSHKSKAKEIIGDVVLGVLLLLSIWIILNQINPDILKLNILRNAKQAPSQTADQQLLNQYLQDTTQNPTDFVQTINPTPIPGYYCFQGGATPGRYQCMTNASNCTRLAQSQGVSSCELAR
ncbi:hypothetical protein HY970_01070 [Candidatus Kaiserbacteria bacterium]|nr:hypothetical protein [Candidatus Kaiserbacteria bacterium]